jgi:hypothetical protein
MSQYQQRIEADRRVHHRLEDARASLVELAGDNSGIVLNISEGGMAILSAEDLDANSLQNLRFQAPEFEHWIETAADLAWISDSRKEAGIRFKDLSDTIRTQLRAGISIATVRARRANQANKPDTTTEDRQEVTESMPSSVAAPATTDSATLVASESENIANEVNSNLLAEETHEDKTPSNSAVQEAAPDFPSPEARRENELRNESRDEPRDEPRDEIDTKEKSLLPQEHKKDAPTSRLDLSDSKPIKPQRTSTAVALDARSSPLARQKSALAEMRFRNLVANSGIRQPGDRDRISNRANISYEKWAAIAALAILGSLLAFLVGWFLGNPSVIKLRH